MSFRKRFVLTSLAVLGVIFVPVWFAPSPSKAIQYAGLLLQVIATGMAAVQLNSLDLYFGGPGFVRRMGLTPKPKDQTLALASERLNRREDFGPTVTTSEDPVLTHEDRIKALEAALPTFREETHQNLQRLEARIRDDVGRRLTNVHREVDAVRQTQKELSVGDLSGAYTLVIVAAGAVLCGLNDELGNAILCLKRAISD